MRATRRTLVSVLLTLSAGCLGGPTVASGPRNPPSPSERRRTTRPPDLAVAAFDFERTAEDAVRVFGTVENRGNAERIATVEVTVRAAGERHVRRTEVAVPSGRSTEFEVVFDVAYGEFARDGEVNVTLA